MLNPRRLGQKHVGCMSDNSSLCFAFSIDKLYDMKFRYVPHPERNGWLWCVSFRIEKDHLFVG